VSGLARAKPVKTGGDAQRHDAPFVEAAWLYYHDNLNQTEIAERMQISRASVVNYLSEARARGWVRVFLDSEVFLEHRLAEALCNAFGLREALIVPDAPDEPAASAARVTRAAADWLPRLVGPGDRLGVSWGQTVYQMAQAMVQTPIEDLTVVQLLGSRPAALGFAAEACTTMVAQKLGGLSINLHVPLLLSSTELRDQLCKEPVVAAQLAALANCNKTVLACGTCNAEAHIVQTGLIQSEALQSYIDQGATGVICGRLIDASGQHIQTAMEDRMIGVSLDKMRNKDVAFLIAAGPDRVAPARAAILGGYVTHLATSRSIAEQLLQTPPKAPS
jgi:DNA-binding transcriptional regulator LsrR (DeoR family)